MRGIAGPFERGGYPVWEDRRGDVEVRFVGRGPAGGRDEVLARIGEPDLPVAWAKQVHSARVLPAAAPGECAEGDALVTDSSGLALAVVTADCVPVLLAGPSGIAAVHAGWRGIASGVIPATLTALGKPAGWTAWIGPAIGPCCYEVGEDVARPFREAFGADVVRDGTLDLWTAAERALRAAGVEQVQRFDICTSCHGDRFFSHRRDAGKTGRQGVIAYVT
jgi:YfiH family protein